MSVEVAKGITATTLAAAGGPLGGLVGAMLIPVASKAAMRVAAKARKRRRKQQDHQESFVLDRAAEVLGITPKELAARLDTHPWGRVMFVRTMQAARAVGQDDRLLLLASSLVASAVDDEAFNISWETAFVRMIEELEFVDFAVLRAWTMTAAELDIKTTDPELDSALVAELTRSQLHDVTPELGDLLDGVLARLQRTGLIASRGGGGYGGGDEHYALTGFGKGVLDRLRIVEAAAGG